MAADNIISLGFNYDELTAEQKKVIDILNEVLDKTKQLNGIQMNPSSDGLVQFGQNLAAQREAIAALTATYPQLTAAQTANNAAQIEAAKLAEARAKQLIAEERLVTQRTNASRQSTTQSEREAAAAAKLDNEYLQLRKRYEEVALEAKRLQTVQAASPSEAGAAAAKAMTDQAVILHSQLSVIEQSVGQYNRNVGNYASALTGYANSLRGLRGPTKLLGEVLGVGAQQADQFRLVIEHALQGIAAFTRGKTEATAADTTAQNINTASTRTGATAQEGLAVATTETSAAMRIFGTAVKFTGIGLLVAGIAYLVYEFIEFKKAAKEAAEQMMLYNDVMADANKNSGAQINDLKVLYAAANDVTASTKDRMAAVIALKNEFPDYFSQMSTEEIMNGRAKKSYDDLTESIKASSRAKAVKDKKDQLESQRLDIDTQQQKTDNANTAKYNRIGKGDGSSFELQMSTNDEKNIQAQGWEAQKKRFDDQRKAIDAQEAMLDKIAGVQSQAKVIEAQNPTGKTPKGRADARDDSFKFDEDAAKSAYEAKKKMQQAELDDLRAMSKNVALSYQLRVDAAKVASMKEQEIIGDTVAYEVAATKRKEDNDVKETESKKQSAKVRASELAAIHKAAVDKIAEVNANAQLESRKQGNASILDVRKLEDDALKAARKANEDANKEGKSNITNAHEGRMSDIDSAALDKELIGVQSLNKKFSDGKLGIKEYNKELAKIKDAIEIDKLKAQIEELNGEWNKVALSTNIAGGVDKDKQLSAIGDQRSKATLALSAAQHKETVDNGAPTKDELKNAEIDIAQKTQETIFGFVEDRFEKEKELNQKKLNMLEKTSQAEIQAISNSTLSNQEKQAQIAIAEKTAASQRTALQKQQHEEDIKKAKFDKAAAILSIIENTAIAATASLTKPWMVPYIIAAGALELAAVAAKPIPAYAKGTESHKGGLAIFGEAGPEMVIEPNKKPYIASVPTLANLPYNTKVRPLLDNAVNNLGNGAISNQFTSMARLNNMMDIKVQMGEERMVKGIVNGIMQGLDNLDRTFKKRPPTIVNNIKDKTDWLNYKDSQTKR